MEDDPFEVTTDLSRCFVRIAARGSWSPQIINRYSSMLKDTHRVLSAHGCASQDVNMLIDVREFHVQTREVADLYQRSLPHGAMLPGRVATLISSALVKHQVKRIGSASAQRYFNDEEEALRWLFKGKIIK